MTRIGKLAKIFWLLVVGATFSGCPPRASIRVPGAITNAEDLLRRTSAIEHSVKNVRGQAKLKMSSARVRGSVSTFVAVQRPSSIHLEAFDFFGRPQSIFVSDGRQFALFNSAEGKFYRGPATPPNVARFLTVPIPPEHLVQLILGEAPRTPKSQGSLRFDAKLGAYQVELKDQDTTQRLEIEGTTYRVRKSEVGGSRPYSAEFTDFTGPPLSFPRRIILELPSMPASVEIRYTDVKLNDALEANLFRMAAPTGVETIELDETGGLAFHG